MAINLNTTTLTEGPEGADEFVTNVYRTAGIFKLVPSHKMTSRGESFPIIPRTTVEEVGETELKPVTDAPITSLVAKPITLATTVPVSKQLINNHAGIVNEVAKEGASNIGEQFDEKVAGTVAVTGSNFGQLSNAEHSMVLNSKADVYAAFSLLARSGSRPNGLFLSTTAWAMLAGAVNANGTAVYNMTGDMVSGTFEGIPYATFIAGDAAVAAGTDAVAYLGDFKNKAKAGTVYEVDVDINPYGGIGEGANYRNLWQRNMIAVRVEFEAGFNFIPSAFVKLTIGAAAGAVALSAPASK